MNCSNKFNLLKSIAPFLGLIFIFILFHFTKFTALKFYPPFMNFLIFMIFFTSIFKKETVIQKIALALEPDINEAGLKYTRNLTYVWAVFCFINFIISSLTVFMSEFVWVLYNGCISYILVGLMFGVEYIVRLRFKKKYDF